MMQEVIAMTRTEKKQKKDPRKTAVRVVCLVLVAAIVITTFAAMLPYWN